MPDSPILLDVSRLIWRRWTRRLPTGIDRVCLAYLQHFQSNARAVVQFRRYRRILDRKSSHRLFDLLQNGSSHFRPALVSILAAAAFRMEKCKAGQIYLNVGHTGLNSKYLRPWLEKRQLRPVFLIHDLIPITHPQYCREGEAARHEQRMETALRSASGLIVNSAATESDLFQFANGRGFARPPSLISWLGIDTKEIAAIASPADRKRPYFVVIGTIEARKNHLMLLKVWREIVARLGAEASELIIIGQRGWEAQDVIAILDDLGEMESHVQEIAGCSDEQMGELLAGARAMLMPSFVEGFGLPIVEALQQGVPVIASDLSVFREIAGEIPTYLNPQDLTAWANAIVDYSGDSVDRQRQVTAARNFKVPTWAKHFARVETFLETL